MYFSVFLFNFAFLEINQNHIFTLVQLNEFFQPNIKIKIGSIDKK